MTVGPTVATLVIAAAAAVGGALGHALAGLPWVTIAAAALGAAVGRLVVRTEPAEHAPAAPSAPTDSSDPARATETLEALPIAVMLVDRGRTVRFANAAFRQMFDRPGIVGEHVTLLRANRLQDRIELALSSGSAGTLEFTLSRAGAVALRAHVRPLSDDGVLVAVEDETQRRRAEEMHRDFVANASHELKTPLAASSGIIETLLGPARDDPEATERFLGLLSKQVVRMNRLIQDLMSLNRIELDARVLPDQRQDLGAILRETVDVLTPVAEAARLALELTPPGEVLVTGDHDQLAQLFTNLIDNAIKYGDPGTTVRIFQAAPDPDAPDMTGITVQDQGIGIAREHLPRLTERFYRVNVRRSRDVGGTGLGLAIVKHILARHRGRLEIESTPGEGSRFTVLLPLWREP